jgi:hypothetical protein
MSGMRENWSPTVGRASWRYSRQHGVRALPATFGATIETVPDKLLAQGVRIGVSPPEIDPLGDYTVRLFERLKGRGRAVPPRCRPERSCRIHRQVLHRQSQAIPTWMRF